MHGLFFLKSSAFQDCELRFSLRSIERFAPSISKVWIFGDRPAFLVDDRRIIEHVPHDFIARACGMRSPVTNFFLLTYLSSLIPDLASEYVRFSDDQILLAPIAADELTKVRYLHDLAVYTTRGTGLWKESLWRTYDTLKRLGYPGYNFETHCPTYYRKSWVLNAFSDLRDFVTEDRWYGLLGPTAILNHAMAHGEFTPTKLSDEDSYVGFHFQPHSYEAIAAGCQGKTFLNFDDAAFDSAMQRYLLERFPEPSKFESGDLPIRRTGRTGTGFSPESAQLSNGTPSTHITATTEPRRTFLFVSELGGGWGHIGVIQPIAKRLLDAGHRVVVATGQVSAAANLLESATGAEIIVAPALERAENRNPLLRTLVQVLRATCAGSRRSIAARCAAWQAIYDSVQPDVLIADHSPVALLTAQTYPFQRVALGQSFTLPDAVPFLPDLRPQMTKGLKPSRKEEDSLLDDFNHWLTTQGHDGLTSVSDVYHKGSTLILNTIAEVDPFAPRRSNCEYLGTWNAQGTGAATWPAYPGKRLLAYVKPFRTLPTLLTQLQRLRASSLIVCPGIPEHYLASTRGTRVTIIREPVDLEAAMNECDLAIGHGTHAFSCSALLAGKPQLMLPLNLEQRLTAQRIQARGAGRMADHQAPKKMILALRSLWESDTYQLAAEAVAAAYQAKPLGGLERAIAMIMECASRGRTGRLQTSDSLP